MTFPQALYSTLKQDIVAKSAPGQPLQALVAGNDWQNVAAYYNAASLTNVWRQDASRDAVFGAITWKNLTVSDAPPSGAASITDGSAANYTNRCLQCQGFQINLQIMIPATAQTLPGDQAAFRQGLSDALQAVPSGPGGALQNAGWNQVRAALQRPGTNLEVLFSVVDQQANKTSVYGVIVDGNDCYRAFTS